MEDEVVEYIIEAGGEIISEGLAWLALAAAVAAASYYFDRNKKQIFDYLRPRLTAYPQVKTVVMAALKLNESLVSFTIRGTKFIAFRYLGLDENSATTHKAVPLDQEETYGRMTAEEIERRGLWDSIQKGTLSDKHKNILNQFSDEELLELGLMPEKVAIGKKMIDRKGKVLAPAVICTEQEVLDLRHSA